ncbi:hypothetical protein AAVH_31718 [Aphelenchoides avenae]|nr:hypothetical protein AAVH_31718 [Aphelenchus avenae]
MTDFVHLTTLAERQRLAAQVRVLLQQPPLSNHHDYQDLKTVLTYSRTKVNRQKGRRKQAAQQALSLECKDNGLGLVCELVTAKGRDRLQARSSGDRFATLVVSKGSEGSQLFSIAIIDSVSKNLDVLLGDEAEVTIVGIQPTVFLNSLCEAVRTQATERDSSTVAEISGVPAKRRPRYRGATSMWSIREWLTLKGFILRVLALSALYEGYRRLEYGWTKIDSMMHYYNGRMPPDMWANPDMQATFELEKSLQRLHGRDIDGATFQALFAKSQLFNVNIILAAVFVDIPKLCLSAYVLIILVLRGGVGPFYRTVCFEVMYLAWDEYKLLAIHQKLSSAMSKTSYASFVRHMLHEAPWVFYICLLNIHLRVDTLYGGMDSPFFLKSNEPRVVDLDEWGPKKYLLPELRPNDKRNIPFVTA